MTVVKAPAGEGDETTVADFRSRTNQARHLLHVRRGPWAFVNVHAESGGRAQERDARATQFQQMSRQHERDPGRLQVLAGDFNIREGEQQCFEQEGWVDAWSLAGSVAAVDQWTWRRGSNAARYDRVYTHENRVLSASCQRMERVEGVWGEFTDHVPLYARLQLIARGAEVSSPGHVG